jgi:hypothetical protein
MALVIEQSNQFIIRFSADLDDPRYLLDLPRMGRAASAIASLVSFDIDGSPDFFDLPLRHESPADFSHQVLVVRAEQGSLEILAQIVPVILDFGGAAYRVASEPAFGVLANVIEVGTATGGLLLYLRGRRTPKVMKEEDLGDGGRDIPDHIVELLRFPAVRTALQQLSDALYADEHVELATATSRFEIDLERVNETLDFAYSNYPARAFAETILLEIESADRSHIIGYRHGQRCILTVLDSVMADLIDSRPRGTFRGAMLQCSVASRTASNIDVLTGAHAYALFGDKHFTPIRDVGGEPSSAQRTA